MMKAVAIVRDRGQLTIPDSIRKLARWLGTSSVVSISIEKPDEILITPHQIIQKMDLSKLSALIKESRSIKGRGTISTSEFIAKDRV